MMFRAQYPFLSHHQSYFTIRTLQILKSKAPINRRTKSRSSFLLSLEKEDCTMAEVKIYKVFGFVGDKGPEVAAYVAVPGWAFALIKLLVD